MPDAGYLTIGKVVKRLQAQYPDLSISKVRYLEDEGLLNPSRTPSGYRLYSQKDIHRLETILYLQKNRFMPLSVIKKHLDGGEVQADLAGTPYANMEPDDEDMASKLHPIDRMPELLGVPVSFVRQLSEAGVISLKESPHGRALVDGRDFPLIRTCNELRHFGIGPKNLRQYVTAANRESAMFEQALVVYAKKGGGVEMELTDESRKQFGQAFSEMLALTGQVRDTLIRRQISNTFKQMEE
ncbi:MAG: MerR family transcriptional regulator [Olsenella sp.]|jgi:DNA-binding transcriptional MerR regulator|nr:MerR family transcriptional regulator [Olsenella sp.]MCI1288460.1 MerR family transcriptional regulator [Olsenella sp.]